MNKLDESIFQIVNDKHSGSVAILQQLIRSIILYLIDEDDFEISVKTIKERLPTIRKYLGHFMVVCHFINYLDEKIKSIDKTIFSQDDLFDCVKKYNIRWKNVNKKIAENAVKLLDTNGKTILLHSNSSAITMFFKEIKNKKEDVKIIQTEARPEFEGRYQASSLADLGFQVDFIVDSAIGLFIPAIDFVIVGADKILKDVFINKIGTYPLALLCREFNKPLYVFADSRKFTQDNEDYKINELAKSPKDIWNTNHPKIKPLNFYFEAIPNNLVSAFITENTVIGNL